MIEQAAHSPPAKDAWLSHLLVDAGLLKATQVETLGMEGVSVWASITRRGLAGDRDIVATLARHFRLDVANLAAADPHAALLVPESVARKHQVLPLAADDRRITLATADPRDLDAEQAIGFMTGRDVVFALAAPTQVAEAIEAIYRPEKSINRLVDRLEPSSVEVVELEDPADARDPVLDAPVAKLVDAMISEGVRQGASDIHAEPEEGATVVRFRVDGVLREVMRLPGSAGASLVRRAKVFARLDVTDPLHPQDGRASIRVDGQRVDLRVSTVPIARRGEKVVVRILDKTNLRDTISTLGLSEHEVQQFQRLLGFREGMLLVTGPTGSGKTTTLYAALNQLKTGKVNIVTVEDPVEYDLPGISQIQVNEAQGLTFATSLRSVLRQDPDIVLLGEIRDPETAKTAIQAGLSGHFVLSTLHTNDAVSAVTRLRDLGVDSFKVASVIKGVIAQRLVRRVCGSCAATVAVDRLPADARPPADWPHPVVIREATGCKHCSGSGYKGRLSVMEIMPADEAVSQLIGQDAQPEEILAAARRRGMRSLWESGLDRLWHGQTTLEELVRVLGEREVHAAAMDRASAAAAAPAPVRPSQVPTAVEAAVAAAQPADGTPRVLMADDDPQMRRLVRTVLEREGIQVSEANDGLDALDLVGQQHFDLLILDLSMPRLDGLGVLEELGAQVRTAQLPVIVLTASGEEGEAKALDLGAQDYLTKPVRPTALTARVRAVLRRVRA